MSIELLLGVVIAVVLLRVVTTYFPQIKTWWRQFLQVLQSPAQKNRVQSHVQRKLIRSLGGDRRAAERLVSQLQYKFPDKSENWCWEKAISDLERDRFR